MDKVKNQLTIEVPAEGFVDEGNGVVSFPNGLTITDGSVQRNGTTYDIDSLDISKYSNELTGDHESKLGNLIGQTIGVVKQDGKVVVNKIRYAVKENPYARLAYNLLIGGFSKNFSTETIGPKPDINTGIYWNAELTGLSQVVTQNNYNAHINEFNEVVHNSLEQAKQDGLDVTGIEEKVTNSSVEEEQKMEENTNVETETKVEETQVVTETETKEASPVEEAPATKESTVKVEVDTEQIKAVVNEAIKEALAEKAENDSSETEEESKEEEAPETKTENSTEGMTDENGVWVETKTVVTQTMTESEYIESEEEKAEQKEREAKWEAEREADREAEKVPDVVVVVADTAVIEENQNSVDETKETNKKDKKMDENKSENAVTLTAEQIQEIVANALAPVTAELTAVKEEAKNAFNASAKEPEFKEAEPAKNDYSAMDWEDRYQEQINAAWDWVKAGSITAGEKLRELNQINLDALKEEKIAKNSITLDDLGNFVIPPEMYREIEGHRNDYSAILNVTEWKETLSLEFAWLKRVGDIDMKNVAIGSTIADGEPAASDNDRLKPISEYSAVPQKSQLEELAAVTVVATSTTRFAAVDLLSDAAQGYRTDYDRKRAQLVIAKLEDAIDDTGNSIAYSPSNDVDALTVWLTAITEISDTTLNGTLIFNARTYAELKKRALSAGVSGPLAEILITGDVPTIFGYRFIVVPNDLMPTLGGNENISHLVDGVPKVINHAVYFADLSTFTGRTSGGLQYDVSNSASYEVGGTTRSAYQRNELVLRGSFFRGGAVKDIEVVAGIRQGSTNVS